MYVTCARGGGGMSEREGEIVILLMCVCLPLFHMLFDQQMVVSCSGFISTIAEVGAHMNPVSVLVVMDTTT